jgi:sec-independent protein translocase protein TatA
MNIANGLTGWHLILLVAVVVLLFGAKRLPDAARSLGKSMRIFKSEVKEMQSDGKSHDASPEADRPATPIASERVEPSPPRAEQPSEQRPA